MHTHTKWIKNTPMYGNKYILTQFKSSQCSYIIYIYIYIDTYFVEHNRHFLSTHFLLILLYCRIDFIIFGGNWLMYLP